MICKFEHDGDCCNSGSPQYMCKCKPNGCDSVVPMSNADRIRAMSDEELAEYITKEKLKITFACIELNGMFLTKDKKQECFQVAKKEVYDWLQQPAKEDD